MRQYIKPTELNLLANPLNEYQLRDINKAIELQKEVSKFYPCEMFIEVSKDDKGDVYYEFPYVQLKHDFLEIFIKKDWNGKKYEIMSYDRHGIKTIYPDKEPNKIGVLTTKKITEWVKYYEETFRLSNEEHKKQEKSKAEFLESIKDLNPVFWYDDNSKGYIYKGGLKLRFEITNGEPYLKIEIDATTSLENFLKMADNKYSNAELPY